MNNFLTTANTRKTPFVVKTTTDLNLFKIVPGNRGVDERHVARLRSSMAQETLFAPLYLNERYEVIDGQHRLRAKQTTYDEQGYIPGGGAEYIVFTGMDYGTDELAIYNTNAKVWNANSFMSSYIELANPHYILAGKFAKEAHAAIGMPVATSLGVLAGWKAKDQKAHKSGDLTVSAEQYNDAALLLSRLGDLKREGVHFCKLLNFVKAFQEFSTGEKYSHDTMLRRLKSRKYLLILRTKKLDFLTDLQDIYR